eukprot:COSAG04_NODE_1347_length_7134_cov_4.146695_4_plen_120_part_00
MGSTHTLSELRPDLVIVSIARWTSALQLRGREFCFILNRAVRGDEPPLADPTAGLSRGINKLCVSVPPRPPFPPGDVCLRGGGFDDRYRRCAAASLSSTFCLSEQQLLCCSKCPALLVT